MKAIVGVVGGPKQRPVIQVRYWKCKNCGHEVPIPGDGSVGELDFRFYADRTSKVGCPACGSFTLQRAWNPGFTAGEFLIVRTKNVIRKG